MATPHPHRPHRLPVALTRILGGALDVRTGEVWPSTVIEYATEAGGEDIELPDFDAPDRFRWEHGGGSRAGYRDMADFVDTLDQFQAELLTVALQGKGAFRRFRTVLDRYPGDLTRWHLFSAERQRGRAREWLADIGYRVARG